MSNPMAPVNPRPIMKIPNTIREGFDALVSSNSGTFNGGGGVKVGKRVSVG
jgi:hypothetical protein